MSIKYKGNINGVINTPHQITSTYTSGAPISTSKFVLNENLNANLFSGNLRSYYKKGYCLKFWTSGGINPEDGWIYYFGPGVSPNVFAVGAFIVPKAGIIKAGSLFIQCIGGAPSAQTWRFYIRKNTTDYTFINTSSTSATQIFTNTALNIAVALGDSLIIKVVCPTWTTNPSGVIHNAHLFIEV